MTDQKPNSVELPRPSLTRFAKYLATQESAITERWLIAVRRDAQIETADRLLQHQLVDHLPRLFQELCEFLRTRDAGALIGEAKRDARQHGELRWQDGYKIDELLRELEAFRHLVASTVFRYRDMDIHFKGVLEVSASALIHHFFSEIVVSSAKQFVQEQQNITRASVQDLGNSQSELGQLKTHLEQAMAEQRRATTIVAHELRNFLRAIPQGVPLSADATRESVRDLCDTVEQLIEYSESVGSNDAPTRESLDLAVLFDQIGAVYRPLVEKKGLQLITDFSGPNRIIGDRARTRRIVEILLNHSLKNTITGNVTLAFACIDQLRWTMAVSDTGASLSNNDTEALIGGAAVGDDVTPARGIGLATVKGLVARLGGSLNVITQPGVGTRIEVALPR